MMAKVPILVFADERTGMMSYAEEHDFGLRVTRDNQADLDQAVYRLVNDEKLRKKLVDDAYGVALKNHDAKKVRAELKGTIDTI